MNTEKRLLELADSIDRNGAAAVESSQLVAAACEIEGLRAEIQTLQNSLRSISGEATRQLRLSEEALTTMEAGQDG